MSRQSRKHRPPIHWGRSCGEELVARVVGRLVFSLLFSYGEVGGQTCFFIGFSTFSVAVGKKNRSKLQQKSKCTLFWKNGEKMTQKCESTFCQGSPKWTENAPKTSPEPKKCVRRRRRKRFLSLFAAVAVRSHSPNRFLEGPTLQNCIISTMGARF